MNTNTGFRHLRRSLLVSRSKLSFITAVALVFAAITATTLGAYVRTGGSGVRTSFGEIEGFGSIVVNGVHYDESAANIIVEGVPGQSRAALKLGMIVQIDGILDYELNTGVADVVRVDRILFGQVESINASAAEVKILQQRVAISVTTRFDGALGLGELTTGDWIAVHGLEDPGRKSVVATLIERVAAPSDGGSSIRGTVQKLQQGKLRIGKLDILVANTDAQDGDFVSVKGDYLGGSLVATEAVVTQEVETHENVGTELQGYVSDFRSISEFTIAGVVIDASSASFYGGRASDLHQNVRVTVEGPIRNGVLIAEEVEFPSATSSSASIELEGVITSFSSLADFVVKGQRIDASNVVLTSARMPKTGWKAHVKGNVAADGTIKATKAEFERP
jgi:hypothetical protein